MNQVGLSIVLQELAGSVTDTMQQARISGLGIKTALVGTLTLTGVTNNNGTPAAWALAPGSVGLFQAPGSGLAQGLNYAYSNPADQGKAFVAWA